MILFIRYSVWLRNQSIQRIVNWFTQRIYQYFTPPIYNIVKKKKTIALIWHIMNKLSITETVFTLIKLMTLKYHSISFESIIHSFTKIAQNSRAIYRTPRLYSSNIFLQMKTKWIDARTLFLGYTVYESVRYR